MPVVEFSVGDRISIGKLGEDLAAQYLVENGYQILNRNYRCSFGEIDIIAQHNKELVFLEVKTRTSTVFGLPQESVTHSKQKRIKKIALQYLSEEGLKGRGIRFDVVGVLLNKTGGNKIELIPNAF